MDALTIKSLMPGIILQANKAIIGCLHHKHAGDTWATQVWTVRVFFLKNLLNTKCFITVGGWLNPQMRNCRYGKSTAKLQKFLTAQTVNTPNLCGSSIKTCVAQGSTVFSQTKKLVWTVSLPAILWMSLRHGLIKDNWIIISTHSNSSNNQSCILWKIQQQKILSCKNSFDLIFTLEVFSGDS